GNHRALHSFPTRRSSDLNSTGFFIWRALRGVVHRRAVSARIRSAALGGVRVLKPFSLVAEYTARTAATTAAIAMRYRILIDGVKDRKSTRLNSSHVAISY